MRGTSIYLGTAPARKTYPERVESKTARGNTVMMKPLSGYMHDGSAPKVVPMNRDNRWAERCNAFGVCRSEGKPLNSIRRRA